MKVILLQKQTHTDQRIPFKTFVTIGDYDGQVGLGVKCSKEVDSAVCQVITLVKLSVVPVWRGSWGGQDQQAPYCPLQGDWLLWLIVLAPVPKKLLITVSIDNCYTSARGRTATLSNLARVTLDVISKTYSSLTPTSGKRQCSPSLPTGAH